MESMLNTYNVNRMCYLFQVSRSSFYFYCKHNVSQRLLEEDRLKELIKDIWLDSYKRYGAPKITIVLANVYNTYISRKKVQKLMKSMKIRSIITKSYKPYKEKPDEGLFINILERDFSTSGINEKWVSDITYIWTDEYEWCYLATILDLHSKRIVG